MSSSDRATRRCVRASKALAHGRPSRAPRDLQRSARLARAPCTTSDDDSDPRRQHHDRQQPPSMLAQHCDALAATTPSRVKQRRPRQQFMGRQVMARAKIVASPHARVMRAADALQKPCRSITARSHTVHCVLRLRI